MALRSKIRCSRCNLPMNPHAEKMDNSREAGEGVLLEIHACPGCGATACRPLPPPDAQPAILSAPTETKGY